MHVGTQQFNTSDHDLEFLARHGVTAKNENNITFHREYGWDVEELIEKKEQCERFGVDLEMVAIPVHSLGVDGCSTPNYMRGRYDEGDKEIELVCNMIRQASEAGIPAVKYFLCEMENQRTESVPLGRGNSRYSTWDLEKADDSPRYDEPLSAEQNWERITYYLERVVPVAEKCKVRMACHPCDPCDPWLPPASRASTASSAAARVSAASSPSARATTHGVNLCLGRMAEAFTDRATGARDHPLLRVGGLSPPRGAASTKPRRASSARTGPPGRGRSAAPSPPRR